MIAMIWRKRFHVFWGCCCCCCCCCFCCFCMGRVSLTLNYSILCGYGVIIPLFLRHEHLSSSFWDVPVLYQTAFIEVNSITCPDPELGVEATDLKGDRNGHIRPNMHFITLLWWTSGHRSCGLSTLLQEPKAIRSRRSCLFVSLPLTRSKMNMKSSSMPTLIVGAFDSSLV